MALASAGKKLGYSYLLDLHYSDFWADPGKQFPPKEWAYAGADALEKHVYDYTKDVLLKLKRLDLLPEMVQVGNEITNGLMWPHGNGTTLTILQDSSARASVRCERYPRIAE